MKVVVLGLSITSSWGNGHATNYRALVRALVEAGHDVTFLERDVPWYAAARDLPDPPWGTTALYASLDELRRTFGSVVRDADLVVVGSYVPDGIDVGHWVCDAADGAVAFYDIDTPVTVAALDRGDCKYLDASLVPRFHHYLSFTSGPILRVLEERWGARAAVPFHCFVDPGVHAPAEGAPRRWDLGYLGTYSDDRQPALDRLLVEPARQRPDLRFVVAGPMYPDAVVGSWPANVQRVDHVAPRDHAAFYAAQRVTLNVTRADMVRWGWSPSVRLFEAAACATPVVSDVWPGIDSFFSVGSELFLADGTADVLRVLDEVDEPQRRAAGAAARDRVLRSHTAAHRVVQLEQLVTSEVRS